MAVLLCLCVFMHVCVYGMWLMWDWHHQFFLEKGKKFCLPQTSKISANLSSSSTTVLLRFGRRVTFTSFSCQTRLLNEHFKPLRLHVLGWCLREKSRPCKAGLGFSLLRGGCSPTAPTHDGSVPQGDGGGHRRERNCSVIASVFSG